MGRNTIKHASIVIHRIGFEAFSFKKLAQEIGTTEAGAYRYFENKQRLLLLYLVFHTNNISDPTIKLITAVQCISSVVEDDVFTTHINERLPYKDLCARIADIITECNTDYKFPRSLSSTIIEMTHSQICFVKHLPRLTDFSAPGVHPNVAGFIQDLVFRTIRI